MARALATVSLLIPALALTGCGASVPDALVRDVEVPDLSGMTLDEATEALGAAGFVVGDVEYDAASAEATWTVVAQDPDEPVPDGTAIALLLAGAPPVDVPDLAGLDEATATERLTSAGLAAGASEHAYHDTVPASSVASQSPAPGSVVPSGTVVAIVLSDGPEPPPSDSLSMELVETISGDYSPKSVVATQEGHVFAQNMMYRHNVTVFDDETRQELATIPDSVDLTAFGYPEYPGAVRGGPVEAAVTPDGRYVYVSNYSMFGPGFEHPGDDVGGPDSGVDPSFVYRIPTDTLEIDQAIEVGSVPKFLAVTPDGRYVLVSNWISHDLSVIDTGLGEEVRRIPLGRYPRGIAVDSDSRTAYVAVMGSRDVATVDLETFEVGWIRGVGSAPRHLVISPDDRYLYATINGEGSTAKVDLETGEVVAKVATGSAPRSMAMAPDGRSLYIVNYESNTVSKVRTEDMAEIQELDVGVHPIGVTYVEDAREIWVSCYRGAVLRLPRFLRRGPPASRRRRGPLARQMAASLHLVDVDERAGVLVHEAHAVEPVAVRGDPGTGSELSGEFGLERVVGVLPEVARDDVGVAHVAAEDVAEADLDPVAESQHGDGQSGPRVPQRVELDTHGPRPEPTRRGEQHAAVTRTQVVYGLSGPEPGHGEHPSPPGAPCR